MHLHLKNIGMFHEAEIELSGITVIAGKNGSGKSTFGKALYAVFHALHGFEERVDSARRERLERLLEEALWQSDPTSTSPFPDLLTADEADPIRDASRPLNAEGALAMARQLFADHNAGPLPESVTSGLRRLFSLDDQLRHAVLLNALKDEFSDQIQNVRHAEESAAIELTIGGCTSKVTLENDQVTHTENLQPLDLKPLLLDDSVFLPWQMASRRYFSPLDALPQHVAEVFRTLASRDGFRTDVGALMDRQLRSEHLAQVRERLHQLCRGRLKHTNRGLQFVSDDLSQTFGLSNLSAGLRVFLFLQELILNGDVPPRGTIILDEPEIHLHPEWQVILAELIVLLQKALHLHVLIASHSPYFISAIDVYTQKHGTAPTARYYFTSVANGDAIAQDVTQKRDVIYDSLAAPYQTIEDAAMES